MLKTNKFISALVVMGLPLCACSDGIYTEDAKENTLSGDGERTPLELSVILQDSYAGPKTRALNGSFEQGDKLYAFIEQVKLKEGNYTGVGDGAAQVSRLVDFTIKNLGTDASVVTSDNLDVALYWDDFSNTTDYIRDADRYLRVGYGYCFNGNTATLNEATSVVEWSVQTDQSTMTPRDKDNLRKSDLLWAGHQDPVQYDHDRVRPDVDNKIKLPVIYSHAMSKVTIELILDEGFDVFPSGGANAGKAKAFVGKNTTPILYANKAAKVNAIEQTIKSTVVDYSSNPAPDGITMYLSDDETTEKKRVYEAIIAPTVMKAGMKLARVEVDGNKYDLVLTNELLKTPYTSSDASWASQLYDYTTGDDGKVSKKTDDSQESADSPDGITFSGINYRLIATLKKQRIEVEAKITDWKDVSASITGSIMFDPDVKVSETSGAIAAIDGSFDLWRAVAKSGETIVSKENANYDADTDNDNGVTKASTYEYKESKWEVAEGSPVLYWLNGNTPYYFRALATTPDGGTTLASVNGSTSAAQGTDLLWAQTSEHYAKASETADDYIMENGQKKKYAAGDPIDPRTGNVPLTFEHAMSKISVILTDPAGATDDQKVNLADAKIEIINLYNGGTISVKDGEIGVLTAPAATESPITLSGTVTRSGEKYILANQIVIPQSLVNYEDGQARSVAPEFYSTNNLTAVYSSDKTSIGTGTATYYLTSDLTPVEATYYTADDETEIADHNAALPGRWTTDMVKEPAVDAVSYTDVAEFNTDKHHQQFTEDQFATLDTDEHRAAILKSAATDAVAYSLDEFKALTFTAEQFNALPASVREKTPAKEVVRYKEGDEIPEGKQVGDVKEEAVAATYYDYSTEYENNKATINNRVTQDILNNLDIQYKTKTPAKSATYYDYAEYKALPSLTADQFEALPEELKIKTPAKPAVNYTQAEVDAHNQALDGYLKVGDVKIPAHYKLEDTTKTSHTPGELKSAGDKIMMYITLADGTRYSIELKDCWNDSTTDNTTDKVLEWNRGEHYTYTISLGKEEITFRALVKDWVEKSTSGNATLDWD